jgi:hypothetical protein
VGGVKKLFKDFRKLKDQSPVAKLQHPSTKRQGIIKLQYPKGPWVRIEA